MCRRHPRMVLISVALLATGCARSSPETTLTTGNDVAFNQVSHRTPSAQGFEQDWAGLCGRWCAQVALRPGAKGICAVRSDTHSKRPLSVVHTRPHE